MEMFVLSKMTGLEKPGPAEFEEFLVETSNSDTMLGSGGGAGGGGGGGLVALGGQNSTNQLSDYLEESSVAYQLSSTAGKVREGR